MRTHIQLPRPVTDAYDWQLRSACRDVDTELFFSARRENPQQRQERQRLAKDICNSCPVLAQCRQYALSSGEEHGIWGAMTEADRRRALKSPVVDDVA